MAKTILIPWCLETGGIPHWLPDSAPDEGMRTTHNARVYEWRKAAPFEPPSPTVAVNWHRGRSAANMILGGPILYVEDAGKSWERNIRAEFYLTQAGVLGLLKAGAFDGPNIRKGVMLMPAKRGQNYLVEAVK